MIVRVGISGIIGELFACGSQLTFLLSAFLFLVAEFPTIPAYDGVILSTESSMESPPPTERSSSVSNVLTIVEIMFMRRFFIVSALAEMASYSTVASSSSMIPSANRTCVLLMHFSSFGHDFLRPIALARDRRREDSLLRGWPILLRRNRMLDR